MHLHACRAVADTIRATPLASHLSALLDHPAPTAEMDQARALARQLLKTAPTPRPLHGDLHHDNVICDTEGTWRVIDPKGLLGDPAFDLANAFRNPVGLERQAADPRRMQRRAEIFAAETGYPTHRLLAWAAVQAAVSIAWDGAEARDVADHAILATALTLAGPRS
mgnify:CR=1 FL=1